MSRTANQNPTFFEPAATERKYRIYVPNAIDPFSEETIRGNIKLSTERYITRLKNWKETSKDLFVMAGKNQPPKPRILITGSRGWNDMSIVRNSLNYYFQYLHGSVWANREKLGRLAIPRPSEDWSAVLISGNAPSGADLIGETVATALGWEIERYPAKWEVNGVKDPNAGFLRNEYMVTECEPDICLAFQLNESRGTADCIQRAVNENIFTVVHELKDTTTSWRNT